MNNCDFKLPFGKYKGQTLDDVAKYDEGLLYLDWLLGCCRRGDVKAKLQAYLLQPAIAAELRRLVDGG